MKAVIIDDGVYDGKLLVPNISERIEVNKNCVIMKEQATDLNISHGTVCASVIQKFAPESQFTSIKIFEKNSETQIDRLYTAFEWCLSNDVDLIHMSFGINNYHEFLKVSILIKKLIQKKL